MSQNPLNLDRIAAKHAQNMVGATNGKKTETLERLVTKALGVLQEQGVYAMMLFLYSRSSDEKEVAPSILSQLRLALAELPEFCVDKKTVPKTDDQGVVLPFFSDQVAGDLDTLFLVRDLYEQTLIYARFGAKAKPKE